MDAPADVSAATAVRRPSRGRRALRWAGWLFMLGGAAALLWATTVVLWQDPFTALYAMRAQHRLTAQYDERVRQLEPALAKPVVQQAPLNVVARRFRLATSTGQPVGKLRIPRMGLSTVVVDGTDHESLKKGPGLDRRTHMPGEGQLVYIAGHRTTYLAPFSRIDALKPGDPIELTTPYATFHYKVTGHVIVAATDVGRLKSRGYEELALQACHPRFFATERYIVYARVASVDRSTR